MIVQLANFGKTGGLQFESDAAKTQIIWWFVHKSILGWIFAWILALGLLYFMQDGGTEQLLCLFNRFGKGAQLCV